MVQHAESEAFFLHRHASAIMWQSNFNVIYAFFEQKLQEFAQEVHVESVQAKPLDPVLRRSFWSHASVVDYLKKQGKLPAQSPAWSEIVHYGRIRHLITHRGGILTDPSWLESDVFKNEPDEEKKNGIRAEVEKSKEIMAYLKARETRKKPGVEVRGNTVVPGPEFCREALASINGFFEELADLMRHPKSPT